MTNQSQATCTLCGLLCSLDQPTQWGDVRTCSRRSGWTAPVPASRTQPRDSEPPPSASSLADSIHRLLSHAQRSLIWLDGADVNTTRAAVELARVSGATVYVPATTGQAIVQRVMCRDGWYGTSLADMAEHSDLIITLGDRWRGEAPLLPARFIRSTARPDSPQWWHLSAQPLPESKPDGPSPDRFLHWPREQWYHHFTLVAEELGQAGSTGDRGQIVRPLVQALQASRNATFVWVESELDRQADELLVYRLFTVARLRSQAARCNLLPIDGEVGRTTARATLLWLTGCVGAAQLQAGAWVCPSAVVDRDAGQWRSTYDAVLLVRVTPSLAAPPDIAADIALCEGRVCHQLAGSATHRVATAGLETPALLMRGDHGTTCYCAAVESSLAADRGQSPPTAQWLMRRAAASFSRQECTA